MHVLQCLRDVPSQNLVTSFLGILILQIFFAQRPHIVSHSTPLIALHLFFLYAKLQLQVSTSTMVHGPWSPTLTVRTTTLLLQSLLEQPFKGGTPCIMIALANGKDQLHVRPAQAKPVPNMWSYCPKAWTVAYFFC